MMRVSVRFAHLSNHATAYAVTAARVDPTLARQWRATARYWRVRSRHFACEEAHRTDPATWRHLTAALRPPRPDFVDAATLALAAMSEGDPERDIRLPDGYAYRVPDAPNAWVQHAPAHVISSMLRLDTFAEEPS